MAWRFEHLLTQLGTILDGVDLLRFGARRYADRDLAYSVGDNSRLRRATGWQPRIGPDAMIDAVAHYWREMETARS